MSLLTALISRFFGWETYDEAYRRILAEIEAKHPCETENDRIVRNLTAMWEAEQRHKRMDGLNGEYIRGEPGLQ